MQEAAPEEEYFEIPISDRDKKMMDDIKNKYKDDTIYTVFTKVLKENPNECMFYARDFNEETKKFGELKVYTRKDAYEESTKIGSGLVELGLQKGDLVFESYNPYRTMFPVKLGIFRQGGIVSYTTGTKSTEVAENSDFIKMNPKIVFTERSRIDMILEKINIFIGKSNKKLNLSAIVIIPTNVDVLKGKNEDVQVSIKYLLEKLKDMKIEGIKVISYQSFLELGEKFPHDPADVKPEDPCFYSPTSNTTGKGVKITIITHKIAVIDGQVIDKIVSDYVEGRPCNISGFSNERFSDFFIIMCGLMGNRNLMVSSNGIASYIEDLGYIQNNYGFGQPALFKYYFDLIQYSMLKGKTEEEASEEIRQKLGGDSLKMICFGGCKLPKEIESWFRSTFKVPIVSAYGCTEIFVVSIGTVQPDDKEGFLGDIFLKKLKIRKIEGFPFITDYGTHKIITGELLVGPDKAFGGYLDDEVKTKKAVNKEGYFYTKDVVEYNTKTGRFYIIDRTDYIISLSNGKNVPSSYIEDCLMGSKYINQAVVFGDYQDPDLTYICTINSQMFDNNTNFEDDNENHIIHSQKVIDEIKKELENIYNENGFFYYYKQGHLILISKNWTIDDNLITTTDKIRRLEVIKKYMPIIIEKRKQDKNEYH